MLELDADGSGEVDFEEFRVYWHTTQYPEEEDYDREIADLFAAVDVDGSGKIEWGEFLEMIGCAACSVAVNCVLALLPLAPARQKSASSDDSTLVLRHAWSQFPAETRRLIQKGRATQPYERVHGRPP
jgi:hypothetical protein